MSNNKLQKILKVVNEFELILNLSSQFAANDVEILQGYFQELVTELTKIKYKPRKQIRVNTKILNLSTTQAQVFK